MTNMSCMVYSSAIVLIAQYLVGVKDMGKELSSSIKRKVSKGYWRLWTLFWMMAIWNVWLSSWMLTQALTFGGMPYAIYLRVLVVRIYHVHLHPMVLLSLWLNLIGR